jgi:site-specific recombinase XerD
MAQLQIFERNFINSIRSKATRESYRWYFSKYRKFVNEKIIHDDPKIIENQIIDFFLYLKQKGLSYNSLRPYLAAITHFYSMNDIVVNCTKISKFISIDQRKKTKSDQGYTTEQIQQLLDVCDERTRAIILLYASSGIRLAALPSLRYGDLKPVKIEGGSLYEITVYQGYMEEYITFCTPECAKVINSYLDYRTKSGETLRAESRRFLL